AERERAAWSRLPLRPRPAARSLAEADGDAQAGAGPAVPARGRAVSLLERLENALLLLVRDADAGIPYGEMQDHVAVSQRPGDADMDGHFPGGGELDGIPDQIDHDLCEPVDVPDQRFGHPGRHLAGQLQPLLVGAHGERLGGRAERFAQIEVDRVEIDLAGLDLREIE